MVDYWMRARKLTDLFETLAPPPTGNIDDVARVAFLAKNTHSPVDAEFDVERPVHITLKDIGCNVIDFMANTMKDPGRIKAELPSQEIDAYMLQSYPIVLTVPLKVAVERPKVAVTEIEGKGKGVVATADISANSIVTFYPADLVRIRCQKTATADAISRCIFFSPYRHVQDAVEIGVEKRWDDYKYSISNIDIYGDPGVHSNGCCGHIVNDGDGPVRGTNNAVLIPLFGGALIAVVAVFDIKSSSEVLASYGAKYWDNRIQKS